MNRCANGLSPRWSVLVLALWSVGCSCSAPSKEERSAFVVPPRAGFEPVSNMLHARCGSLDCHGQAGRNLRLYGVNGLRAAEGDLPGEDGGETSAAEHDANYEAIIALEPEILDRVVREGGRAPERLTLVRKARNIEDHVGGEAIEPGSEADRCLTSWIALSIDVAACESGAMVTRP